MAVAYDPLSDEPPVSGMVHPDTYDPFSDQPNRTRVPVASGDMIPGVPPGPLSTSYKIVPSRDNGGGLPWIPDDPVPTRVREAAHNAYINAPSLGTEPGNMSVISTKAQDWLNRNLGPVGGAIANFPGRVAGQLVGNIAGAGAAAGQTLNEIGTASGIIPPRLQRDINLAAPLAATLAPALKTLNVVPREIPALRVPGTQTSLMPANPPPAVPRFAGGVGGDELQAALQREALRKSGLLGDAAPDGPSMPTGIAKMPDPEGHVPGVRVFSPPLASADAVKTIASDAYKRADRIGGEILPTATDIYLDRLGKIPKQTEAGKIFAGADPVTGLIEEAQKLRGKPLTLQAIQEMDEALGDRISDEWSITGLSKTGERLQRAQRELRDTVANLGPNDVASGEAGFKHLKVGREAWAQYAKMRDLERMQSKANMMENPTTSFKVMVRNMLNDPDKIRGWSMEERMDLKDAGDRGTMGNMLHALGGRLVKYLGAGIGAITPLGPVAGGGAGFVAGEAGGAGLRSMINSAMNRRIQDALTTLGGRVRAPEDAAGTIVVPRR